MWELHEIENNTKNKCIVKKAFFLNFVAQSRAIK